jgi:hypothetical protein
MWTVDATTDHGQLDAYHRAVPLMDAAYAATLTDQPTGTLPSTWRDHRAHALVHLTHHSPEGDVEPDTPTLAHRAWTITVHPTGRDGWTGAPIHTTAFVTLQRPQPEAPWRVSAVGTA